MKIDVSLRDAISALDLSTSDARFGAAALVIVLLENIWSEEAKVPGRLEKYHYQIECFLGNEFITEDDELRDIHYAISALYRTYGLMHYQRLGICNYLKSIDAV